MSTDHRRLLERDTELAAALSALTAADEGAVALVGEAGIGKTTLLEAVAGGAARDGLAVRRTQGAAAEVDLPFIGLHDLFADDLVRLGTRLSPGAREALDVALLRTGAPGTGGTDALTLNLGIVEVTELLSAGGRLLVVLDDLQWIDEPTLAALRFAFRRVSRSRVAVLAAMRPGSAELGEILPDRVATLRIGPLDVAALAEVVEQQTGVKVVPRLAVELHELSGGNPLLALEMVRSSDPARLALRELTVPQRHRLVLERRVDALSDPARDALLAAALLSRPSVTEVTRTAAVHGLVEAETAGLVAVDSGRIRFTHPLFASVCRELTSPEQRRDMHRRLAEVADDETERARHLGRATLVPDEGTAASIAKASSVAADRAATATAADLALLAAELTPEADVERRAARFCAAAILLGRSGDAAAATRTLQTVLEDLPPGDIRARCLFTLASVAEGDIVGSHAWLREARSQPGLDPADAVEIDIGIVDDLLNKLQLAEAFELSASLVASAEAVGRPDLAANSRNIRSWIELMTGTRIADSSTWPRMVADGPTAALSYDHPDLLQSWEAMLRDDHARAAELMESLAGRARAAGDLRLHAAVTMHLAHLGLRRGRLSTARAAAEEALWVLATGRADQAPLSILAQALAMQGELEEARAQGREALAMAQRSSDLLFEAHCRFVLGFVEVSDGRYDAAAEHVDRLAALLRSASWGHPNVFPWHADGVETLLALGRVDDAIAIADLVAVQAARVDIPTAGAMAARCRGLVLAHTGRLAEAEDLLASALEVEEHFRVPMEAARSLLALGTVRRRLRQKARARDDLARSRDIFRECGAAVWAGRADRELERAAAVAAGADLTSSERSVAELAAAGVTNREIAGRLFLSEKTVEAVLTRVYRKLSVRSRTELARHPDLAGELAARQGPS